MRDFYIAMSHDYQLVYDFVDGVRINSYYRSGQKEGGDLALHYARAALHLFNRLFGSYPYTELDVVPTPTNAGGIEYPGVIVTAQSLYPEQSEYLELVVAHEVAHQWWYGLVGSDQLDEPWMDEALTNYCAYIYFQRTTSPEKAQHIKKVAFEDAYRELQQNHSDRAIGGPVADFRSQSDYVAVVYGKGPLFFDAVRERLGDERFFAGLRLYLERHRYGVAYPEDLIAALEEASGQSIDDLYNAWVLGEAPQEDCAGEH
jgi:aminopeptidase N